MMPNQTFTLTSANGAVQSQSIVAIQGALQANLSAANQAVIGGGGSAVGGGGLAAGGMSKPRLTPLEVKAVHYVMRILHKNGRMLLQTIPGK